MRRQHPETGSIARVVVAVKEASQLLGVGVEVQHKGNLLFVSEHQPFNVVDGGSHALGGLLPSAVGVQPCQLGPCVAVDHPIGVHHRNYLEHIVVVEGPLALFRLFHQLQQVTYYSLQHETRCCLDRVLSTDDPHYFALFGRPPAGGDSDEIDCVFGGRFAQFFDGEEGLVLPGRVNAVEEVEKLGVRVGVGGGEVDSVKGLSELVLEGQGVVGLVAVLSSKAVLLVENLNAVPMPAEALPAPLFRIDQGLKPVAEERLLLGEVDDVEPHLLVLVAVPHPEVKPLVVPPGVDIVLQNQIVGVDAYFGVAPESVQQVATFEVGVEKDRP